MKQKGALLIQQTRSGLVEQEFYGFIVLLKKDGSIKKIGQDCNYPYFHRSSSKPLQASVMKDFKTDDFYQLGCGGLILSGERRGTVFRPGEAIEVKLEEASPISGSLILKYLSPEDGEDYYQKGHGRRPEGAVAPKRGRGRKSRGRKSATIVKKAERKGQK